MQNSRKELIEGLDKIKAICLIQGAIKEAHFLQEAIETLKSQWDKLDHMPFYRGSMGGQA